VVVVVVHSAMWVGQILLKMMLVLGVMMLLAVVVMA